MSDGNANMAAKLATIREIQSRGFRVHIRQCGAVEVWRNGAEANVTTFHSLSAADRGTRYGSGSAKRSTGPSAGGKG